MRRKIIILCMLCLPAIIWKTEVQAREGIPDKSGAGITFIEEEKELEPENGKEKPADTQKDVKETEGQQSTSVQQSGPKAQSGKTEQGVLPQTGEKPGSMSYQAAGLLFLLMAVFLGRRKYSICYVTNLHK